MAAPLSECPKCGGAKVAGTCRRSAGWGTDHVGVGCCKLHLGSTPLHRLGPARVEAERALSQAVAVYGLDVTDVDPAVALLEEVARSYAIVRGLQHQIGLVEDGELTWGKTLEESSTSGGVVTARIRREARVHVLIRLFNEERKHHASVCRDALAAGVQERFVRLAEHLADQMTVVFRAALSDPELMLNDSQRELAERVLSRHLGVAA